MRVVPVCARGRDVVDSAGVRLIGVANEGDPFDVVLFVLCLDENVEPNKFVELELEDAIMGPDIERVDEIDILLELRDCAVVVTDDPDAARRGPARGEGGARNFPPGDADSFEKLLFLSRL